MCTLHKVNPQPVLQERTEMGRLRSVALLKRWTSGIRYITRRGFLCIKALGRALDPPGLLSDVLQGSKRVNSIKNTVEHEEND